MPWMTYRNQGCDLVELHDSYALIGTFVHSKLSVGRKTIKIMQNLAIMARSCKELPVWPVWNHVWFLDIVVKKGQHGLSKRV